MLISPGYVYTIELLSFLVLTVPNRATALSCSNGFTASINLDPHTLQVLEAYFEYANDTCEGTYCARISQTPLTPEQGSFTAYSCKTAFELRALMYGYWNIYVEPNEMKNCSQGITEGLTKDAAVGGCVCDNSSYCAGGNSVSGPIKKIEASTGGSSGRSDTLRVDDKTSADSKSRDLSDGGASIDEKLYGQLTHPDLFPNRFVPQPSIDFSRYIPNIDYNFGISKFPYRRRYTRQV